MINGIWIDRIQTRNWGRSELCKFCFTEKWMISFSFRTIWSLNAMRAIKSDSHISSMNTLRASGSLAAPCWHTPPPRPRFPSRRLWNQRLASRGVNTETQSLGACCVAGRTVSLLHVSKPRCINALLWIHYCYSHRVIVIYPWSQNSLALNTLWNVLFLTNKTVCSYELRLLCSDVVKGCVLL